MRVLHVTNTYLPVRNGVTISVAGWAHAMCELGVPSAVWTTSNETPAPRDGVFSVRGIGSVAHGFPMPMTRKPPREVAEADWDVVHVHHPVLLGPSAVRMARAKGSIVAATAHSDYLSYVDAYAPLISGIGRPTVAFLMSRFFNSCDLVFAPSESIASALRSWGVTRPIESSSYPVDRDRLNPTPRDQARRQLGLEADVPLAIHAGRLAADKNVLPMLEAFERTLAIVPTARLVVCGHGPQEAAMRSVAERLGEGAVRFEGELGPRELGLWYSAADVMFSASTNEVGPLVTIEAGLCATPTLAPVAPGFSDRVVHGATGVLTDAAPEALGSALGELLLDRSRAAALGEAAEHAMREHEPKPSAARLIAAYEWFLGEHSR